MNLSLWIGHLGFPVCEWTTMNHLLQNIEFTANTQLSSSLLATFNGIETFVETHDARMELAEDDHMLAMWHSLESLDLRLLLLCDKHVCPTESLHLRGILKVAEASLRMLCHLSASSTEAQLQQEVKNVHPMMRHLVSHAWQSTATFSLLTILPEVLLLPGLDSIYASFSSFLKQNDLQYAALFLDGRRVLCSSLWAELSGEEQVVVQLLLSHVAPSALLRDMALYVPTISTSSQYRVVSFTLVPRVQLCLICGSQVSIAQLRTQVSAAFDANLLVTSMHPVADSAGTSGWGIPSSTFQTLAVSLSSNRSADSAVTSAAASLVTCLAAVVLVATPALHEPRATTQNAGFCLSSVIPPRSTAVKRTKDSKEVSEATRIALISEFYLMMKSRPSELTTNDVTIQSEQHCLVYHRHNYPMSKKSMKDNDDSMRVELFCLLLKESENSSNQTLSCPWLRVDKSAVTLMTHQLAAQLMKDMSRVTLPL